MTEQALDIKRTDAKAIFAEAVAAADPALALRDKLITSPFPPPQKGGRSIVIAVGKAAPAMLQEALRHIRGDHTAIAVTHSDNRQDVPGAKVLRAGHPIPNEDGLQAGRQVIELLSKARAQDQVIALISGGGSALIPAPVAGVGLADKARVNQLLLSSGLDIVRMNLIRQQLSQLKGGGFLRLASPAPVTSYILSDVIGDDLRAVASGPTVSPIGSLADARRSCIEAGFWHQLPTSVRAFLDQSLPEPPTERSGNNILIGSNRFSLLAALDRAAKISDAKIVSDALTGDVSDAADAIVSAALTASRERSTILLFGGETTVRLTGTGLGGRNQELALRFALQARARHLEGNWIFLSGGTDGRDGPTPAAGAIVDMTTLSRMQARGGDPQKMLSNNDSHTALSAVGDLLLTKATGTNVADIQILMLSGTSSLSARPAMATSEV